MVGTAVYCRCLLGMRHFQQGEAPVAVRSGEGQLILFPDSWDVLVFPDSFFSNQTFGNQPRDCIVQWLHNDFHRQRYRNQTKPGIHLSALAPSPRVEVDAPVQFAFSPSTSLTSSSCPMDHWCAPKAQPENHRVGCPPRNPFRSLPHTSAASCLAPGESLSLWVRNTQVLGAGRCPRSLREDTVKSCQMYSQIPLNAVSSGFQIDLSQRKITETRNDTCLLQFSVWKQQLFSLILYHLPISYHLCTVLLAKSPFGLQRFLFPSLLDQKTQLVPQNWSESLLLCTAAGGIVGYSVKVSPTILLLWHEAEGRSPIFTALAFVVQIINTCFVSKLKKHELKMNK